MDNQTQLDSKQNQDTIADTTQDIELKKFEDSKRIKEELKKFKKPTEQSTTNNQKTNLSEAQDDVEGYTMSAEEIASSTIDSVFFVLGLIYPYLIFTEETRKNGIRAFTPLAKKYGEDLQLKILDYIPEVMAVFFIIALANNVKKQVNENKLIQEEKELKEQAKQTSKTPPTPSKNEGIIPIKHPQNEYPNIPEAIA